MDINYLTAEEVREAVDNKRPVVTIVCANCKNETKVGLSIIREYLDSFPWSAAEIGKEAPTLKPVDHCACGAEIQLKGEDIDTIKELVAGI